MRDIASVKNASGQFTDTDVSPNAVTYSHVRVVRSYIGFNGLFPAEREVVKRFMNQFTGDVLDIAVGAGRTTRVLSRLSRRYEGIDFSEAMISLAAEAVPRAADSRTYLQRMDMRSVPEEFAGDRFDAIIISFNGIDYIGWEDRNKLLSELRALLKKDGVLVFSTHDLAMRDSARGFRIRPDLRINTRLILTRPLGAAARFARLPFWVLRALPNHWRNRGKERDYQDYAYVNDLGENYGLVTVYTGRDAQIAALESFGYRQVEVLHPDLNDAYTCFNYFVCRPSEHSARA